MLKEILIIYVFFFEKIFTCLKFYVFLSLESPINMIYSFIIKYYSVPNKRLPKGAMSPFIQKVILLCVLTLLSVHNILGVQVKIVNTLEGNLDVTVHCKSKDDNLGAHLHHGDDFSFKFEPKVIFGNTLFFCSFIWAGELKHFNIYQGGDLRKTDCDNCNWNIFKSGPCRHQESRDPICFPWNKQNIM